MEFSKTNEVVRSTRACSNELLDAFSDAVDGFSPLELDEVIVDLERIADVWKDHKQELRGPRL